MTDREFRSLRRAADYQFGRGAGATLFPAPDAIEVTHTSSGRPRQVLADGGRLATYGTDGRYTLGFVGGRRLVEGFDAPRHRVVVGDESEPFVREGRNAFAKFVQDADSALRPGDEVLVVHADGHLLAVGRAELPGHGMRDFETGMAVKVRHGADSA
ncbi:PUA domain-containing protein [Halomicroarcula sp. GCM10025324]|uniref:PUA domain-containing protein n=1 Tax=Haloarcula TaxID=2237 RepID=UPI0023E8B391|nr:PUA domain-containing protein [Halomicroarcula sp. ZS-22-S1]